MTKTDGRARVLEFLILYVWGGAQGFVFLVSSQVMLKGWPMLHSLRLPCSTNLPVFTVTKTFFLSIFVDRVQLFLIKDNPSTYAPNSTFL